MNYVNIHGFVSYAEGIGCGHRVTTFHFCLFSMNVKIKARETVFQGSVRTTSFPWKSLRKIKVPLKKGSQGLTSTFLLREHIRGSIP